MYSIVLMTALATGQGAPAGWGACNPNNWWYKYGAGYGGCYGVAYGGWPETGSLCTPPGLEGFPRTPFPVVAPNLPATEFYGDLGAGAEQCARADVQTTAPNRARLIVAIPDDARLYVDDQPIQTATAVLSFQTPELARDQVYYYEVRAERMRDGRPVSETRRVAIKAGDVIRTDFRSLGQPAEVVSARKP